MFAFITDGIFVGLFKYDLSAKFYDQTCSNLSLDKQKTDVLFFEANASFEKLENNFEIIGSDLIIYDRPANDELKIVEKVYPGEFYVNQGEILKEC